MIPFVIKHRCNPRGKINVPGDKSIAHRALLISALARGTTQIKNFPEHDDSLATLNALLALGVKISTKHNCVSVYGKSRHGLCKPQKSLFVNNSGATLRLLLGILSGQNFKTKINTGKYLRLRPMSRVNIPLRLMGALIAARKKGSQEYPPLEINGNKLKGITYSVPVASAQVKSAILLAGLMACGKTRVMEKIATRDHTERMLKAYGADIKIKKNEIILNPQAQLTSPGEIYIPGDISSAAFFIVWTVISSNAQVNIESVSLNPGRLGLIHVLKRMQAKIKLIPVKNAATKNGEPCGNIIVNSSRLKATVINTQEVPSLIDELPVLMVAACFAQGKTVIKSVGELRVKETDRINSMLTNLKRMQADIRVIKTGRREDIVIHGPCALRGARLKSFGDHRTAMSIVVAALAADGQSQIDDLSCVNKSFPGFLATLKSLAKI